MRMNYTNSTSIVDNERVDQLYTIILGIQLVEVVGMTCANLLVIGLYFRMKRERQKISNNLLLSQAVTDLYNAIMMWYEMIINFAVTEQTPLKYALELVKIAMLEYSFTVSLGTLLLGALERYLAITNPYYHKQKVTLMRIMYSTFAVWFLSLIPPCILLALMNCNIANFNKSGVIIYSFAFDAVMIAVIIFVVTMLLLSLTTARAACSDQAKLTRHQGNQPPRKRKSTTFRKKLRLVVIFLIMMVLYIITFLPLTIGRVLFDVGMVKNLSSFDRLVMIIVCHTLYKSSALFNPFLTIFLKEDYRRTFVDISKIKKPDIRGAIIRLAQSSS